MLFGESEGGPATDASATDAAGPVDAVPPADGEIPFDCTTRTLIADDFNDQAMAPMWSLLDNSGLAANAVETEGGLLELSASAGAVSGYGTSSVDLRNREVAVTLVTAPNFPEAAPYIEIIHGSQPVSTAIFAYNGMVYCRAAGVDVATVSFVAAAHRHWRLRDTGNGVACEVSRDRQRWETLNVSQAIDLSAVELQVKLHFATPLGTPGTASIAFDNLEVRGPPPGGWCPLAALNDDFEVPALDPAWTLSEVLGNQAELINGEVRLVVPAAVGGGPPYPVAALLSTHRYTGEGSITLEMSQSGAPTEGVVELAHTSRDRVGFLFAADGSLAVFRVAAGETSVVAADAGLRGNRFWRLRFAAGLVHFETSAVGVDFTELDGSPISPNIPLTGLQLQVLLAAIGAPTSDEVLTVHAVAGGGS